MSLQKEKFMRAYLNPQFLLKFLSRLSRLGRCCCWDSRETISLFGLSHLWLESIESSPSTRFHPPFSFSFRSHASSSRRTFILLLKLPYEVFECGLGSLTWPTGRCFKILLPVTFHLHNFSLAWILYQSNFALIDKSDLDVPTPTHLNTNQYCSNLQHLKYYSSLTRVRDGIHHVSLWHEQRILGDMMMCPYIYKNHI